MAAIRLISQPFELLFDWRNVGSIQSPKLGRAKQHMFSSFLRRMLLLVQNTSNRSAAVISHLSLNSLGFLLVGGIGESRYSYVQGGDSHRTTQEVESWKT
jgi:hypothetical protein